MPHWGLLLVFSCVPGVLICIGSLITFIKQPSAKLSSAIQHLAAGIIVAVVAVELIPMITNNEKQWLLVIGFAVGVATMLCIDSFSNKVGGKPQTGAFPWTMIAAIGTDLFIDGILVGVSFLAKERSGLIIAIALSLETLFLGLSLTIKMIKDKISFAHQMLVIISLAITIPIGALIGYFAIAATGPMFRAVVLSFGVAALLYLVTEELLTEAHEIPDTKFAISSFFVGFLLVLLIS